MIARSVRRFPLAEFAGHGADAPTPGPLDRALAPVVTSRELFWRHAFEVLLSQDVIRLNSVFGRPSSIRFAGPKPFNGRSDGLIQCLCLFQRCRFSASAVEPILADRRDRPRKLANKLALSQLSEITNVIQGFLDFSTEVLIDILRAGVGFRLGWRQIAVDGLVRRWFGLGRSRFDLDRPGIVGHRAGLLGVLAFGFRSPVGGNVVAV